MWLLLVLRARTCLLLVKYLLALRRVVLSAGQVLMNSSYSLLVWSHHGCRCLHLTVGTRHDERVRHCCRDGANVLADVLVVDLGSHRIVLIRLCLPSVVIC